MILICTTKAQSTQSFNILCALGAFAVNPFGSLAEHRPHSNDPGRAEKRILTRRGGLNHKPIFVYAGDALGLHGFSPPINPVPI
jgi:hypothetical protein